MFNFQDLFLNLRNNAIKKIRNCKNYFLIIYIFVLNHALFEFLLNSFDWIKLYSILLFKKTAILRFSTLVVVLM